jgi:aminopeptidase C
LKPINTLKTKEEKLNQNRFFFWYKRENRDWIKQRLQKANRPDLAEKLLGERESNKPMPKWLEERRKKR